MIAAAESVIGKRSFLRVHPFLCPLLLAGSLLPASAWAQQSTSSYNFGSQAIGASATQTLTLTIPSSATLGGIAVSTQGVANLDFTSDGGSCTVGTAYAAGAPCTVSVTFKPRLAGCRYGAVVLSDGSGNVLATDYLQGSGTGPQVNFLPGTESSVGSGWEDGTESMMVDGSGNLYITDSNGGRVLKETWTGTGYTQSTFLGGTNAISPGAVDGAGNLYMINTNLNQVQKWTWTGSAYVQTTIGSGLYGPTAAAVDGAGNVYIADAFNGRVLMETLSAGAYTQSVILTCGVSGQHVCPSSVAVDGIGNVYVTGWQSSSNFDASRVLKMTPSAGGYTQSTIGSGMAWTGPVVVDGSGNLFVNSNGTNQLLRETLSAGSYIQSTVTTSGLAAAWSIAVDGSGNLYVANNGANNVLKVDLADAPSLNFPTATGVGSTDTTDGTMTEQIENVGTAALNFTALSYPVDFPEAGGYANACTGSTSLDAGQQCDLPIEFTPLHGGALSEDVMLTDNALNGAPPEYAQQSISLTGASIQLNSIVITPSSSFATLPGGSQQFTATGSYSGGSTQDLTSVSWNSTNTAAVTIGAFGLATAQAAGAATITASLDGVTSNAVTLTVDSAAQASIAVSSGSGQSANETAAFANSLVAVVKSAGGNALQDVPVTFTAPSSGAGASFSNGAGAITVASDGNGLATVPVVANAAAGNYSVVATVAGISGSASFSLTNLAGTGYPTYYVTTLVDDSVGLGTNCTDPTLKITSCSLRDAVTAANALPQATATPVTAAMMPTINFASSLNLSAQSPGVYNITNGGTLTISANMNIVGPGASLLSLNGAGNNQIFSINSGTVFLSGLSLVNGVAPNNGQNCNGGGIYNNGTLTVTNGTFSGNSAIGGGNGCYSSGGGIYNSGTLTVTNSTFSGNSATGGDGGGPGNGDCNPGQQGSAYGGGIENGGTLTVANSIFSANSANNGGNQQGAGIYNNSLANADSDVYFNNQDTYASGEDDCNGCTTNTKAVSGDPKLTALGNYGGPTQTMLPQPGSAAICAGAVGDIPVGVTTDQRGFARTNSTYEGGTVCVDAGAVQTNYAMAFTTEPPAIVLRGQAISPAPAVALTESGAAATAVTSSVAMTDSAALLSGTTTASFLSGTATFSNLLITSVTSGDKLIATLALNPTINLTAQSTAFQAQTTLPAALTSPTPGTVLAGSSVTFTWTAGTGATEFDLWLGLSGPGSSSLYSSGVTAATSATVTGLQTKGATIYARLFYEIGGVWSHLDYTFTEATSSAATMISPGAGATLGATGVMFNWTAGTSVTSYALWLGTRGPGSSSLYASPLSAATSVTVPSLPANGAMVYARLFSEGSGGTQYIDYTYTEATGTSAVLTSPTPGSTLGTSNVVFTWSGGTDVTKYDLLVGLSGPGSTDLFYTGSTLATTATAPKLPANGAKIYVRLMSDINGTWRSTDYIFTTQ
jgi:CSLREA domain-containing protein